MTIFKRFPSQHSDFIHDMSFNLYGQRLATCSSDRKIKIWELKAISQDKTSDRKGYDIKEDIISHSPAFEWRLQSEWNAHQASVWKVAWAHPEFGQIIASCSFDRTVSIWEDQTAFCQPHNDGNSVLNHAASRSLPASSVATGSLHNAREGWRNQAQLVDSRESVHDVEFAPRHLGLRLATASEDGLVRMYEAIDVMNLSHWPLQEEFLADRDGTTCISWNKSRFDIPSIIVGGNSGVARVWGYNNAFRRWQVIAELQGHNDAIHDVQWAPNMGRSFHLIATASKDRAVRIWKLVCQQEGIIGDANSANTSTNKSSASSQIPQCSAELIATKHHHDSEVWRVEWNVTGTMLASSGDDGTVRMWKPDHEGNWVCVNTIAGDLCPLKPDSGDKI